MRTSDNVNLSSRVFRGKNKEKEKKRKKKEKTDLNFYIIITLNHFRKRDESIILLMCMLKRT